MTLNRFIRCIEIVYNYGIQQTNKRIEPKSTIIAWCGYSKLLKAHEKTIYAAYKSGVYDKLTAKNLGDIAL